jgi:hypothetical protein
MDQAEALVRAFIRSERVPRYLALLDKKGGRKKLRAQLAHLSDLDLRFAQPISGAEANPAAIERLLRTKGAPSTCYCLSESRELDGKELLWVPRWRGSLARESERYCRAYQGGWLTSKPRMRVGVMYCRELLSNPRMQPTGRMGAGLRSGGTIVE